MGHFLLELKRHKKLLKSYSTATQTNQQRAATTFLSPITPTRATSQLRATQMDSRPGHSKWLTINRVIGIFLASRPWRTTISPPLSLTNKSHYLPPLQVLPSFHRPCHSRLAHARYLSKTKITIYLT